MRACFGLKTCLLFLVVDVCRSRRPRKFPEQPQSRLRRAGRTIFGIGAGGPRNLVLRHRLQRPVLHLLVSAAPRRRDRLVQDPRGEEQARPVPGMGRDARPGLLRSRRPELSGAQPRRDLWLPILQGRRRASEVRRARGLSRPWRATSRMLRSTRRRRTARRISARTPVTCGSARRPERWACANSPIRASTRRNGASSTARLQVGTPTASSCRPTRATVTRAPTGCSTARSSRRSASGCRAAPATSPTIR